METTQKVLHHHSPQITFLLGMRDTLPLVIAATPFAIVFGALGVSYNLPPWLIISMSIFVFAGASQFIAITLLATATASPIILFTVFIVNLRHALYAASLMPVISKVPQWLRVPMAFGLTDETFAVANNRLQQNSNAPYFTVYYMGSALFMYVNWVLFSILGLVLGSKVTNLADWGLEIAMVVAFIGIVVPMLKKRADWACIVTATVCTLISYDWPHKTGLLFSSFIAIGVGFYIEQVCNKNELNGDEK